MGTGRKRDLPLMYSCHELPLWTYENIEEDHECNLSTITFFDFYTNLLILRDRQTSRTIFSINWYQQLPF